MARERSSRRRRGVAAVALVLLPGAALAALSVGSAVFDQARLGRFPDTAAAVLAPCCRLAAFDPAANPARALAEAPLAAFPFWDAARHATATGDATRARSLAREAVRRDPRLAAARLWLAQDAISTGRFDAALDHLDWLYAVAPDARTGIATAIAQLAMTPVSRAVVERRATSSPHWLPSVIETLVRLKADPGTLFRVSGGADVRSGVATGDKSAIIRDLIARKDYDRAYLAWVATLPAGAVGPVGYVYDQGFRNLPGLQPFNWTLLDSDVASVDYASGGGAIISYFGNGQARFLEQSVLLPPGAYRLTVVAGVSSDGDANKAIWAISCGTGQAALASLPITAKGAPAPAGVTFRVPADCPIQTVSLEGAPSDYPATTEIKVTSVTVVKDGGAR